MACSPQSLMDEAACFACLTPQEKTTLELVLLSQWAGFTGTVQELMDDAGCFACLPREDKSTLELQLLCDIAIDQVTCFTVAMSSTYDDGTCSGTATVTPSGGVGPYSYEWSNGQTTQTATGLCAGLYSCIVVDLGRGGVCADAGLVTVQSISDLLQFSNELDDTGTCDGGVTVTALFGTGPYTYQWTDDSGTQAAQFTDVLSAACGPSDWHIEVTDSLGEVITGTWHVYRAEHTGQASDSVTKALTAFNSPSVELTYDAASLGLDRFQTVFENTVSSILVATLTGVSYQFSVTTQTSRSLTNTSGVTADVGGTEDLPFELNLPGPVQDTSSNQRVYGPTSRLAGQTVAYASANRTYDSGLVPIGSPSADFDGTGTLQADVAAFAPSFTPDNGWTSSSTGNRSFGCTVVVVYDYHCVRQ